MVEMNEQPISSGDARVMMEILKNEIRLKRFYGSAPPSDAGSLPASAQEGVVGADAGTGSMDVTP